MENKSICKRYLILHCTEIALGLLLVMLSCVVIMCKENYQNDEYFSYGAANSIQNNGGMRPRKAPYTYSPAGDALYEWLTVQQDDPFDLVHVWKNQAADVHPPFYYLCIYTVSFLLKGKFTKWIGGSINILFLLLALAAVRRLSEALGHPKWETNLISVFFVLSPGILMHVALFRMYVMAMCEMTWLTYLIVKYRGHEQIRFYVLIGALSVVGALTHYYCLVYMFFISLFYGLCLLFRKRFSTLCRYLVTMACAGGISCGIYPAMIGHIFGGEKRGKESFDNLRGDFSVYWDKLKFFFGKVDGLLFGGIALVLCLGLLWIVGTQMRSRGNAGSFKLWKSNRYIKENGIYMLAVICYFLLVSKIAVYYTERYMYPVYGVMLVGVFGGIVEMAQQYMQDNDQGARRLSVALAVLMIFLSVKNCNWDYCCHDNNELVELMNDKYGYMDALCVLEMKRSNKIRPHFMEMFKLSSITFFEEDVSELADMEEMRNKEQFILYVVTENIDPMDIIEEIERYCPEIDQYEMLGKTNCTAVYLLSGNP